MALINKISSTTGKSEAIQNADNYVWYAKSKYYSWICSRRFGPATSEDDSHLRGFFNDDPSDDPDDDKASDAPAGDDDLDAAHDGE